ncbi:hypothetical protein WA026_004672 [Henosepilachna vigintioctopunctata]|uniref:Uncharacterized protein n=1 Tax=Henosepilachna vigintioctopunctata TaxID=420089 RepID=A0AAW1VAQ4_9CUCU
MYVKENYNCNIVSLDKIKAIEWFIKKDNVNIRILSLYRSPSLNESDFVENLQAHLSASQNIYDLEVIVRDINIDISENNYKNNSADEYLNTMSEFNFVSVINSHTGIEDSTYSCIDHIFVKHNNTNFD